MELDSGEVESRNENELCCVSHHRVAKLLSFLLEPGHVKGRTVLFEKKGQKTQRAAINDSDGNGGRERRSDDDVVVGLGERASEWAFASCSRPSGHERRRRHVRLD